MSDALRVAAEARRLGMDCRDLGYVDRVEAERDRYREAIDIALPALEGYLNGESGLPFTDPYRAARTAAEALHAAVSPSEEER